MKKGSNPRPPLEEPYRDWAKRDAERAGYKVNSEYVAPLSVSFIRKGPRPGPPLDGPAPRLFPGREIVRAWARILVASVVLVAFFLA